MKFYTGPCYVHTIADYIESVGIRITCRGTEHVYCDVDPRDALKRKYGTIFGIIYKGAA